MSLSASLTTFSKDISGGGTITSPSFTPGTNTAVFWIMTSNGTTGGFGTPADSGTGLSSWTNVFLEFGAGAGRAVSVWRSTTSSPGTGTLSLSNGNACTVVYGIVEVTGGPNTSTLRQTASAFKSGSPYDPGLSATLSSSEIISVIGSSSTVFGDYTANGSYNFIYFDSDGAVGGMGIEVATGITSGTADWTFTGGNAGLLGIEVPSAAAAASTSTGLGMMLLGLGR